MLWPPTIVPSDTLGTLPLWNFSGFQRAFQTRNSFGNLFGRYVCGQTPTIKRRLKSVDKGLNASSTVFSTLVASTAMLRPFTMRTSDNFRSLTLRAFAGFQRVLQARNSFGDLIGRYILWKITTVNGLLKSVDYRLYSSRSTFLVLVTITTVVRLLIPAVLNRSAVSGC